MKGVILFRFYSDLKITMKHRHRSEAWFIAKEETGGKHQRNHQTKMVKTETQGKRNTGARETRK